MAASYSKGKAITSINITPMVDIILVLLVIFMVTSSAMSAAEAIEVDKPAASTGSPSADASQTLVITCDESGRFYAGAESLADGAAVTRYARSAVVEQPSTQAIVRCDRAASVDSLVTIIDALRDAGVKKYAISTEPVAESRRQIGG
ncbi:MAG: biopolymer transporter ExbD [Myxococcota bacterium]